MIVIRLHHSLVINLSCAQAGKHMDNKIVRINKKYIITRKMRCVIHHIPYHLLNTERRARCRLGSIGS